MAADIDFTQFRCVGEVCFHLPVDQRNHCTAERHLCPYDAEINPDSKQEPCRCCARCAQQCSDNI